MEVIGNNSSPIGAQEIFAMVSRTVNINRVTVYRILELLVERELVERLSGRGRSLLYGMAPCEHHPLTPISTAGTAAPYTACSLSASTSISRISLVHSLVKSEKWKFGYTGSARTVFIRNKFQCNTL
jgi:Fur family ferric uptake transcriptional regulator